MNNVFVYCEIEGTQVQEVSQELLTKGRKLANELGVELHAIVAGTGIKGNVEEQILPYGVDKLFVFDGEGLFPYTSAPHTDILVNLFKEEQPQICLMGATVIGRDLVATMYEHNDGCGKLWPYLFAATCAALRYHGVHLHRRATDAAKLSVGIPI